MRRIIAGLMLSAFMTGTGWAQDAGLWVQVEAQPTLGQAQTRVRDYAGRLEDVSGYFLGSGWYAVVLGPYAPEDAATLLSRLRGDGAIPSDSFLADGGQFRQQFWPIGAGAETRPQPLPDRNPDSDPTSEGAADIVQSALPEVATEPVAPEPVAIAIAVPDETLTEAQASEALLSRPEKELLQIALQWAGFYDAAIDGAYGRGTRAAMSAWQEARGYAATGILTTAQRAALLGEYNAVLAGLDLQLVRDDATGIEMQIPTGVVEFAGYEPGLFTEIGGIGCVRLKSL